MADWVPPGDVDIIGFLTDSGASQILDLFTGTIELGQYLWVALCRTAPNRFSDSADLDEVDTDGYERVLLTVGDDWLSYQGTLFNDGDVTWTAEGDVRGWAVLDSPIDGRVFYGGDFGEYFDATGTFSTARNTMVVSLAISDWAMEGE